MLENVCFDTAAGDWYFYQDASKPLGKEGPYYPKPLVDLQSGSYTKPLEDRGVKPSPWVPKTVVGPVPKSARFVNVSLGLLYTPHHWRNFGHAFIDNVKPLYAMARLFDRVAPDDTVVVGTHTCGDICLEKWQGQRRSPGVVDKLIAGCEYLCQKFQGHLLGIISDFKPLTTEQLAGGLLCFKSLAAGIRSFSVGNMSGWFEFRQYALSSFGHKSNREPDRPLILIVDKNGRRRITNPWALKYYLEKQFGNNTWGGIGELRVQVINPEEISWEEELSLFSKATVAITPAGGISYSTMFLSQSSTAIYIDAYDPWSNTSWHPGPDHKIWDSLPFQTLYYGPKSEDELSFSRKCYPELMKKRLEARDTRLYRDCMDTKLDVTRMGRLVHTGLIAWQNSLRET
jgi:hypothetical protein